MGADGSATVPDVHVDLPVASRGDAAPGSHRLLGWSVALAVLVVVAAGIVGTASFSGPRWVPNLHLAKRHHTPKAQQFHIRHTLRPFADNSGGGLGTLAWVLIGIIGVLVAAAIATLLYRWWAGRRLRIAGAHRPAVTTAVSAVPVEPEPDTPALRSAIDLALDALDEPREPADAIVRAWLGLQETAEASGIIRQPAETPTEFTSRILGRAFGDDQAVRTLLRLYLRARFGERAMTGADVAAARAALQDLTNREPAPAAPARGV
jgi:hypothetical protein